MEGHHREDGERTDAVEPLDVAQALTDGRRVRVVERDGRPAHHDDVRRSGARTECAWSTVRHIAEMLPTGPRPAAQVTA